jgi:TolB protein
MRRILSILSLCLVSVVSHAADSLFLELSSRGNRTDLGLADFVALGAGPENAVLAREIREVSKSDLAFTQLFNVVEGGPAPRGAKLNVGEWSRLGVDVIVTGELDRAGGRFSGSLRDANTGQTLLAKSFPAEAGGGRRVAHRWVDEIVRYFTGQLGSAASRIVFVNDATGKKEVCVVDYDGLNFKRLTNDRSIALFPKLSPDGEWVVYTTFREGAPQIHLMRSDGRERRPLCRNEGLNSAAAWMPDGKSLVATLSFGRDPNLYLVGLDGRVERALTNTASIDTAPSPSPDGLRCAFTSDRPGNPQIYTMDLNGANLARLTDAGLCDSPSWSPQGDRIAYAASLAGGNYDIYTVEVGTRRVVRLTYGEGDNENPAWSPDGRHLVFTSSRRGRPELWIMGADGAAPRPLGNLPGSSYTPHWGY